MLAATGHYLITFNLTLAILSILAISVGLYKKSHNLILVSKRTLFLISLQSLFAFVLLAYLFVQKDYSVRFIAEHASNDLPIFYLLSAVWGGMNGSLLLWNVILSVLTLVVFFIHRKKTPALHPYFLLTLSCIHLFLLFLLSLWSNPFKLATTTVANGAGLNPLLQNIGMIIHPPMLYLGYVSISIPFAFAMSALLQKDFSSYWIQQSRRWIIFAWFILTMGMFFGGAWAYVELGWGGYWAWDPVENASLMPWLAYTALLHSLLIQEKRNNFVLWNFILVIVAFCLSILGTFITRSGILNSVHAFANSPIGPFFLVLLAGILILSQILLIIQFQNYKSKNLPVAFLSKVNFFVLMNLIFLCMLFSVMYATLFPLIAEGLLHKKMSVQAPFFNSVMSPLASLALLILGFSHLLGWRITNWKKLQTRFFLLLGISIIITIAFAFLSINIRFLFLCFAISFALLCLLPQGKALFFFLSTSKIKQNQFRSFLKNRRKQGALLIHLGIIIMLLGFLGNFFNTDTSLTLGIDESAQFQNNKITLVSLLKKPKDNSMQLVAHFKVEPKNKPAFFLDAAKVFFPRHPEPITKIGLKHNLTSDLYLSLASLNKDDSATFMLISHPLINLVWLSIPFYILGFLLCFSYKPVYINKFNTTT